MQTPEEEEGALAILALGSNLNAPADRLADAVRALRGLGEVVALSSVYRTEPVGFADQPDFLNQVCVLRTALAPAALLEATQRIERSMGRERSFRNAPRIIDIDLLDHGAGGKEEADLVLPHPRLQERAFVLVPLAEAAPAWRHPRTGRTAAEMLQEGGPWPRVEQFNATEEEPD